MKELLNCKLCPRSCNINRYDNPGFCGATSKIKIAKSFLHMWEEPCISGENGSGTVFFSNCNLRCVFCQNHQISQDGFGEYITTQRLSEIFIGLQEKGAHNINLVTATPYIPHLIEALDIAKLRGLKIPVIYNSSGYESIEAIDMLSGYIDIYLPDIKYYSSKYSEKYSHAYDYFKNASMAVLKMYNQVGDPIFEDGILKKGLMIRHLMLPGLLFDSKKIIDWVLNNLPRSVYLNIMCQYTPMSIIKGYPELNRKISKNHYEALLDYALDKGLINGFFQDFDSATSEFVPKFDLEGI